MPIKLKLLMDYWDLKRRSRLITRRNDIDPVDLKEVLSSLAIFDVLCEQKNFRYRLVGTEYRHVHGLELTGKLVTEIKPSDFSDNLYRVLQDVVKSKSPQYTGCSVHDARGHIGKYLTLYLPLSFEGSDVNQILIITDYGKDKRIAKHFFDEAYGRK